MEPESSLPPIAALEGRRLGPYEIVELVGRGGMAVVYKALQPGLQRHVAVKVLPPQFVHEEGFRVRFQREAETVAHLEHPSILPIYDFGQDGDVPYIVMPLITGGTLHDWLEQKPPLDRAIQVFSRILGALEYAHAQHIIHRDIKPTNVLMSQGDWPLLADFGLAKMVENTAYVTQSGVMMGTPEYMAPEQGYGVAIDLRADLYAMGVLLYLMLTGQLPYQAGTPFAVMYKQIHAEIPSPRSVRPELSTAWDEVIQRSLAKEPDERYLTARAMDEAVQQAWRQVQRESGEWRVGEVSDPGALAERAEQALARGDWQRVIALCGQILANDPAHATATRLLAQAQAAMRGDSRSVPTLEPAPRPPPRDAGAAEPSGPAREALPRAEPPSMPPATPARPAAQSPSRRAWGTARTAEDYRAGGLAMAGHRPRSRSGASGETPVPTRSEVSLQAPAVAAPSADRRGKLLQTALMLGVVVVVAAAALLAYQRFSGGFAGGAGPLVYVTTTNPRGVAVIDGSTRRVVGTVRAESAGSQLEGLVIGPKGTRAYAANYFGNSVLVIDTANNTVLETVPVGLGPRGMAVNAAGTRVYTANYGSKSVSVLDATANRVAATVLVEERPWDVAISPDGSRVYVTNNGSNSVSVIDTESNAAIATVPVGSGPRGLAVADDGQRLYVANYNNNSVSVIDTDTNAAVADVPVGERPWGVAVAHDGSHVYVTNNGSNNVSVVDSAAGEVVATVPVESGPRGAAVTADGSQLYVANYGSNSVSIVDTSNHAVLATVSVGSEPASLAVKS